VKLFAGCLILICIGASFGFTDVQQMLHFAVAQGQQLLDKISAHAIMPCSLDNLLGTSCFEVEIKGVLESADCRIAPEDALIRVAHAVF